MARKLVYKEIEAWLRGHIVGLQPGTLLPTVNELCHRFDVGGVQTIRNAYQPLIDEGLVDRIDAPRRWVVAGGQPVQRESVSEDLGPLIDELEETLERASMLLTRLKIAATASQSA